MKTYNVRGKEYTSPELNLRLAELEDAMERDYLNTELDDEYQEFLDMYKFANQ